MARQKSLFSQATPAATAATAAAAAVAEPADKAPVATPPAAAPAAAAVAAYSRTLTPVPPPARAPFELELRRLVRQRLDGDLDFEAFCKRNLELHFQYGRPGYDVTQYERDIREYREREKRAERRRQLDRFLRGDKLLQSLTDDEPDDRAATTPRALGA